MLVLLSHLYRDRGVLEVKGLWWEKGIRSTKARRKALEAALQDLAARIGARDVVSGPS